MGINILMWDSTVPGGTDTSIMLARDYPDSEEPPTPVMCEFIQSLTEALTRATFDTSEIIPGAYDSDGGGLNLRSCTYGPYLNLGISWAPIDLTEFFKVLIDTADPYNVKLYEPQLGEILTKEDL